MPGEQHWDMFVEAEHHSQLMPLSCLLHVPCFMWAGLLGVIRLVAGDDMIISDLLLLHAWAALLLVLLCCLLMCSIPVQVDLAQVDIGVEPQLLSCTGSCW